MFRKYLNYAEETRAKVRAGAACSSSYFATLPSMRTMNHLISVYMSASLLEYRLLTLPSAWRRASSFSAIVVEIVIT